MTEPVPSVVLASSSAVRADLLRRAGVRFSVETAMLDEGEIKGAFRAAGSDAASCAIALAEAKAGRVAQRRPDALVIGADQILVCDGVWFDKPEDRAAARRQLLSLRDRRHELVTAVAVVGDQGRLWHHVERPALVMRNFSDNYVDAYLAAAGDAVLSSVGSYQLEATGIQLFAQLAGDYFSILGLPLLPLLDFLRGHGVVGR